MQILSPQYLFMWCRQCMLHILCANYQLKYINRWIKFWTNFRPFIHCQQRGALGVTWWYIMVALDDSSKHDFDAWTKVYPKSPNPNAIFKNRRNGYNNLWKSFFLQSRHVGWESWFVPFWNVLVYSKQPINRNEFLYSLPFKLNLVTVRWCNGLQGY